MRGQRWTHSYTFCWVWRLATFAATTFREFATNAREGKKSAWLRLPRPTCRHFSAGGRMLNLRKYAPVLTQRGPWIRFGGWSAPT